MDAVFSGGAAAGGLDAGAGAAGTGATAGSAGSYGCRDSDVRRAGGGEHGAGASTWYAGWRVATMAVGGTPAKWEWSNRNAATSRTAPSPTRTPFRMPGAPNAAATRPFGLFGAYASSSTGFTMATTVPKLSRTKYVPPVDTRSVRVGAMDLRMARFTMPATLAMTLNRAWALLDTAAEPPAADGEDAFAYRPTAAVKSDSILTYGEEAEAEAEAEGGRAGRPHGLSVTSSLPPPPCGRVARVTAGARVPSSALAMDDITVGAATAPQSDVVVGADTDAEAVGCKSVKAGAADSGAADDSTGVDDADDASLNECGVGHAVLSSTEANDTEESSVGDNPT